MVKAKVTEKWVKRQVVKQLRELGAYYFFPVASGYDIKISLGIALVIDENNLDKVTETLLHI